MFELIFLGTSGSVPSPERNQSGLLIAAAGQRILIDCGEGTQRQLLRSGAGFRRLRRILLTHAHLDHILGLPGLLATMGLHGRSERLSLMAGPQTLQLVTAFLAGLWGEGRAPVTLELSQLAPGPVVSEEEFTVECFPVQHGNTDSLGYTFQARPRRHLRSDILSELGIPDGPVRKRLADGLPIELADGRSIDPEVVLGPLVPGAKLVVVGDAGSTSGLAEIVQGADALVIEATYLDRDSEIARSHDHLTAAEAATLAAKAGVKRLILNHISGRYPAEEILAEAREIFPAAVVASDMERIAI
jgi:ribonuclease Z